MKKRTIRFLAAVTLVLGIALVIGHREKKTPSVAVTSRKWDLWQGGTKLRGANVWQKRIEPALDGDSLGEGAVGPPYDESALRALASLGANVVNVSHPGVFAEKAPYALDEAVEASLESILTRARAADLFAVVSFRTGPGRNEAGFDASEKKRALHAVWGDASAQDAWVAMWRRAATRLRGRPEVVGYHLMVEPNANAVRFALDVPETFYARHRGTLADWNPLASRIVASIREIDPETPILVGGEGYSGVPWVGSIDVPGDRVVLNAHFYEPYDYTHQPAEAPKLSYPSQEWSRAWLAERLSPLARGARDQRRPAAVLEYGVMRWEPGAARYLEDLLAELEAMGVNHAVWLWESTWPRITYDEFNFRRGPDPAAHADLSTSPLGAVLARNWALNRVRPSGMSFHLQ